jgi:hypothetical protein
MGNIVVPPIRPLQQPDLMEQYGRAVQLKNLLAAQQMLPLEMQQRQQAVQAGQLQLQAAQREAQYAQNWQNLWQSPTPPTVAQINEALGPVEGPKYIQSKQTYEKNQLEMQTAKEKHALDLRNHIGSFANAAAAINYDPGKIDTMLAGEETNTDPEYAAMAHKLRLQFQQNPATIQSTMQQLQALSPEQQKFAQERQVAQIRAEAGMPGLYKQAAQGIPEAQAALNQYAKTQGQIAGTTQAARVAAETTPQAIAGAASKAAAEAAARVPAAVQTEIEKAKALAPELSQVTKQTVSGIQYADTTELSGPAAAMLKKQAYAAGLPVIDKTQRKGLEGIDTARKNMQFMLDAVGNKLASGAPERLWYGPANTIKRLMQTDPAIAAMGTFRNPAIQVMRAVAGAEGLRVNRSEIEMAVENDIPKDTDTLPVAQAKLLNLSEFLNNTEASILGKTPTPQAPAAGGAGLTAAAPIETFGQWKAKQGQQ